MSQRGSITGPLVGVSAIVTRNGEVLLGLRQGAHGAGTWAFPGGKVDPGEHPLQTVRRELLEETGLVARTIEPVAWTSDVFEDAGLHFITLHHVVEVDSGVEPSVLEPDKVREWRWCDWDDLPTPLFVPATALLAGGWRPGHASGDVTGPR